MNLKIVIAGLIAALAHFGFVVPKIEGEKPFVPRANQN